MNHSEKRNRGKDGQEEGKEKKIEIISRYVLYVGDRLQ